jgi:tetratricopeptide (TPR) repeat protein
MARKCEDVAVTNPDFFETYLSLEAEAPGGDKAKAIEARQNLAKRNPDNRGNMTRLCSLLINSGNTADAEKLIAGLLKSDPNDPVAVQLKAACLGRQGKVADAVQFLQDFIASRKPEDRTVELYVNTGRLMIQLGQPDAAIKLLTDNRSAQNPRKPGEKQSALIDRELGDMKYNLASSASSKAEYKQYLDAALASYQAVLDSGSEDEGSMVRKRMVEVCLKAEYFDKMNQIIAQLPQAVQNDPTLILLQAEAAAAQGQKDKALRLYDQAVAADNQNPIVYLKRGDFKSLDPATLKDSLADYEQMKRVDKNSVIARVRMARVLRMMGRDEEAVRAVKEAITIDPFNESMRLALALMLREIGKNTEAAQAMEDAVTQFEGAKQWRMGAAQYWARVGRWDKAVEHMRAVWKDDQSVDVAIPLVEYLINSGDVTNAYNVLQSSAIASKVNDSLPLRLLRARVYAKTGRNTDAAQEIADSVSRVRPESLEEASLFIAGVANLYPDVNEQTGVLDRLEKTRPFTGFLALKAAEVRLRNTSTHDAAIATLQALTDNPRVDEKVAAKVQARAWSLLGTDSYARKNWNEAHDRFEKGQKLDPTNAELNNNLAYILATKLNRCKEALPFAKEACRLVPNKSDFLDTLGAAQVGAQLCDDAAKTLNLGIQAALNDAERIPLYIHMGKARLCQGDRIEARRVASVALDMMSRLPDVRTQYQPDWDDLDKSINAN